MKKWFAAAVLVVVAFTSVASAQKDGNTIFVFVSTPSPRADGFRDVEDARRERDAGLLLGRIDRKKDVTVVKTLAEADVHVHVTKTGPVSERNSGREYLISVEMTCGAYAATLINGEDVADVSEAVADLANQVDSWIKVNRDRIRAERKAKPAGLQ